MIVTHRWLSLVLGLVLLLVTTSGAILVYGGEIQRALHSEAYAASPGPAVTSFGQAQAVVHRAHPDFVPAAVVRQFGVLSVTDYTRSYTVDPATGRILGYVGAPPWWLGLTENLHECGLTCAERPGYVPALTSTVPGTGWLGFDGAEVTVGGLLLGVFAVLLFYLCLTGLWLWFPRPRRLLASVSVRWRKGRFARDTDLHKVIGVAALLPLTAWAVTGAAFELGPVEKAWYAITLTAERDAPDATSTSPKGPPIGVERAIAAAQRAVPGAHATVVYLPTAGDPTSVYQVGLHSGFDPYRKAPYPDNVDVAVDQRSGAATISFGDPAEPATQRLWQGWYYAAHTGFVVNGWWRLLWFVLGMTPLALAITGTSTWLVRRGTRRRRNAARAARA